MPALGVGGFFFRAQDPDALSAWYREQLGVGPSNPDEWAWSTTAGPLVFAPFEASTDYWSADNQVMINLRVSDLDGLLQTLRDNGIEIITDPEWNTPESGRFARIHDPEGNPIELWEPPA
ncbi:VOC family protein [Actinomycetes bacterium M1A6_2h]